MPVGEKLKLNSRQKKKKKDIENGYMWTWSSFSIIPTEEIECVLNR